MHKSTKILSTLASLLFLISILLGIIFTCSFNHSFYQYEYDKSHQAEVIGMSDKDLLKATDTLLGYLENKRDDIVVEATVCDTEREVFNEREHYIWLMLKIFVCMQRWQQLECLSQVLFCMV